FLSFRPPPPMTSTLFPYTTLFRSFDVIDRLEDLGDDVEDRVFGDIPDPHVQEDIFRLKRLVVRFRRLIAPLREALDRTLEMPELDRKSTRLNSSHSQISYAVFCLK